MKAVWVLWINLLATTSNLIVKVLVPLVWMSNYNFFLLLTSCLPVSLSAFIYSLLISQMAQACKPLCRRAGVWTSVRALAYGRMRCLSRHWFLHQLLCWCGFLLHLRFRRGCFITKPSAVDYKFPGSLVVRRKIVPLARRTFDISAHIGGNVTQCIVYLHTTLFFC